MSILYFYFFSSYRTAFNKSPETKQLLVLFFESLRQMCFALPKRATAKLEDPGPRNSVGNTNGPFSKILFLFAAVCFGYIIWRVLPESWLHHLYFLPCSFVLWVLVNWWAYTWVGLIFEGAYIRRFTVPDIQHTG